MVLKLGLKKLELNFNPRTDIKGSLIESPCKIAIQKKKRMTVRVKAAVLGNGDLKVVDVVPKTNSLSQPLARPTTKYVLTSFLKHRAELIEVIPVVRDGECGKNRDKTIGIGKLNGALNLSAILNSEPSLCNRIEPTVITASYVSDKGLRARGISLANDEGISPIQPRNARQAATVGVHNSREKIGNGLGNLISIASPTIEPHKGRPRLKRTHTEESLSTLKESPSLSTVVDLIGKEIGDEGSGTRIDVDTELGNAQIKMLSAQTVSHDLIGLKTIKSFVGVSLSRQVGVKVENKIRVSQSICECRRILLIAVPVAVHSCSPPRREC